MPWRRLRSKTILAETGIRGGEICALRITDLDLENALVYVRQSVWRGQIQTVKSRKGNRRFPISPELVGHLRTYLRTWHPNALGLLFATKSGTPWDHSMVRKRKFHPLLKKLGIPQCGLPCLPAWQCHIARPDRRAHGSTAESAWTRRCADHDGLHTRGYGR